jgi:hypothetical protein
VTARDLRTGRETSTLTQIADEGDVGRPSGISPLGLAGAAAVAEAAGGILPGAPSRQTGDMCVKVTLRELRDPLRFCNSYAVEGLVPNSLAGAAATDMSAAVQLLDSYRFATLHPTDVQVGLRARTGVAQAFITGATAPSHIRRGQTLRIRLRLHHTQTGARTTQTIRVPIPRSTPRGQHTLRIVGTPADVGGNPDDPGDLSVVFEEQDSGENQGARSLTELRSAFKALGRISGVTVSIGTALEHEVFRDPRLRITGRARVLVTIRR